VSHPAVLLAQDGDILRQARGCTMLALLPQRIPTLRSFASGRLTLRFNLPQGVPTLRSFATGCLTLLLDMPQGVPTLRLSPAQDEDILRQARGCTVLA